MNVSVQIANKMGFPAPQKMSPGSLLGQTSRVMFLCTGAFPNQSKDTSQENI
jgi:hypothetical protein